MVVARKKTCAQATTISANDEVDGPHPGHNGVKVSHTRSKSAPSARPRDSDSDTVSEAAKNGVNDDDEDEVDGGGSRRYVNGSQETIRNSRNNNLHHGSSDSVVNEPFYDLPEGEDYMAIYETIDRKRLEVKEMKARSASMEELETPTASIKSFNVNNDPSSVTANCKAEPQIAREKKRHRSKSGSYKEHRKSIPEPLPGKYL